ncbi:putative DNA modification/repair radical SAM protein [Anaerotalea alkaliphila]|uniref:Putative DNA modification/repair radical SAM protein n=1 Tax=Anaerotalea alkaliphila TaxID=2662126 RepID=A0A7X5HTY9_9FIRM|nr:putative DNA modification/repair radical SAM protein [Anaerotalea alkaliphila]NDL66622.1 putative DNA modification/repair radical SAM protein [Anaerotalea alkaliphila]
MDKSTLDKLQILADGAKYDVSCASSGVEKKNQGGLGNAAACGICHTWSSDGRCVSLLKTLVSNDCVFDCAYCASRSGNDIPRASFTAEEIVELTIGFYRRNYIEGLFLSSAIERSPNHTMEKIVRILQLLREREKFFGYIHVKAIPGADPQLIHQAGLLADRMSVNLELPTRESLALLAPQKKPEKLYLPMEQMAREIRQSKEEQKSFRHAPKFVPGGQSTQMIVGATRDSDRTILKATQALYRRFQMKRVYFSAYMPVNGGSLLPSLQTAPPLLREHRLYQADWLLRFYGFTAEEILPEGTPDLDLEYDPKIHWAFRHLHEFPVEVNKADYKTLLRVPGIGPTSAGRIVRQRGVRKVGQEDLQRMGVALKRARHFLTCGGKYLGDGELTVDAVKEVLHPLPRFSQVGLFDPGQGLHREVGGFP